MHREKICGVRGSQGGRSRRGVGVHLGYLGIIGLLLVGGVLASGVTLVPFAGTQEGEIAASIDNGAFDGSGELSAGPTHSSIPEMRIREYLVATNSIDTHIPTSGSFGATFNTSALGLAGVVDISKSKTIIESWLSCGISGSSPACSASIEVGGQFLGSVSNCDTGFLEVFTGHSATNPGRGHGYVRTQCTLTDYRPFSTGIVMEVVNNNAADNLIHAGFEVRHIEVYTYNMEWTPPARNINVAGSVNGDIVGAFNGSLNGDMEFTEDAFSVSVANQTVNNLTINNSNVSVVQADINQTGDWAVDNVSTISNVEEMVNANVSIVEFIQSHIEGDHIEFLERMENVSVVELIEMIGTFDNRTIIDNLTSDSPNIEFMQVLGDQLLQEGIISSLSVVNQSVEGDMSVGNQTVQTQVNMPNHVSMPALEFWLPLGFFFFIAGWAWIKRQTLVAAVACLGVIGGLFEWGLGVISAMVMLMIVLWLDYFLKAPRLWFKNKRAL
jgi:hypothetical protein